MSIKERFLQYKQVLFYAVTMALLVFLLKWLQWKYMVAEHSIEIYIGVIAILFTALGIWVATQLIKPKTRDVIIEKRILVPNQDLPKIDTVALERFNLSDREYEVLQFMAEGKTNAEIASQLYLSISTIKTHASNLYGKLDVKRRTQAIDKARKLRII